MLLQFCTDKGGWLAETFTSEEQSIMDQMLDKSLAYWIGLTASAVVEITYRKIKIYPHKVRTRKIPLQQFCLSDGHVSSKTLTNKLRALVEVVCSGSIFLFTILSILH